MLSHLSEAPERTLRMGELTDAGFDIVDAAAPTHLRSVRRTVLDSLTATDQRALVRIAQKFLGSDPPDPRKKLHIVPDGFG